MVRIGTGVGFGVGGGVIATSALPQALRSSTIKVTANTYMHIMPSLQKATAARMDALLYGTG